MSFKILIHDVFTGLKQRICEDFLLNMTYAMMDILAPVMRLNLFFQGQDVDIGTVQV